MVATGVLAHAFGQRYDSPVPLVLFVLGGAAVVLFSFALVVRREVTGARGAPVEEVVPPRGGPVASAVSVLLLAGLVLVGFIGNQNLSSNLMPTTFWVMIWVALPLAVGIVGDFTGPINPFATLARLGDRPALRRATLGSAEPLAWPRAWGYWPAVGLYLVVVVGELIVQDRATIPRVTATALVAYAVLSAVAGLVFGARTWCTRGEAFTVTLATWGRLGYFRFRQGGPRGFAGGLRTPFDATPSRVVFLVLLLATVTYDGLTSTPQWNRMLDALPDDGAPGTAPFVAVGLAGLTGVTLVMLGGFGAFAVASARAGRRGGTSIGALNGLLPSLLPISYGYLLAHYLQYTVINGQLLIPLAGDPLGRGASFLPYPFNADYLVNTGILPTSVIWYFQIVVIVVVHVIAVVLAHRHLALASSQPALARRSEWPWLVAMVGYTMISLWLLAQPLIERGTGSEALR